MRTLLLATVLLAACTSQPATTQAPTSQREAGAPSATLTPEGRPLARKLTALDLTDADSLYIAHYRSPSGWLDTTLIGAKGETRFGRGFDEANLVWWAGDALDPDALGRVSRLLQDPIFEKLETHLGQPPDQSTPTTPVQSWIFRHASETLDHQIFVRGDKGPLIAQLAQVEQIARTNVRLPRLVSIWRQPDHKLMTFLPCEIHQIATLRPVLSTLERPATGSISAAEVGTTQILAIDRVDKGRTPAIRVYADDRVERISPDGTTSWIRLTDDEHNAVAQLLTNLDGRPLDALCPPATREPN